MKEADDAWRAFSERLFDQNKFAIKLGLESMRVAFEQEGDPQRSAPAIVVGGTNGKGGTSARIAAILEAHGLRVGFYSSPHLVEVRERFRISGRPVTRETALRHGREVLERWGDPDTSDPCLTFFELTTLIAARIFAEADVDVSVWEVGLGGRLDAVNAIEPALTVITSIGFDHQQYLGETIQEIAAEKAALIRPDVPVVVAHQEFDEARSVLLSHADDLVARDPVADELEPTAPTDRWNRDAAIAAARRFLGDRGVEWQFDLAERALSTVQWWGRMERRIVEYDGRRQVFLIDAAHNPQGAERFFDWLSEGGEEVGAYIFTAMADKDIAGLTKRLSESSAPWVHARIASPRAASTEALRKTIGRSEAWAGATDEALRRAVELASGQPVVIFGSLYLLGECYAALGFGADDFSIYG